ncbi:prenylcysteine oxidase 1-like [Macrobrachium nipponense]|uniref:prenylcysteine oxidase 1-like n=1 Tax=Macrobrachium nipponense TaxID=159736 RepID=UPI0030C883DC
MMLNIPRLFVFGLITVVRRSCAFLENTDKEVTEPPKIAIIGGGIGGTSASYFLSELFGDDAILDLYEADTIGGRLATIPIGERKYEVGGSIIHPKNEYMVKFASKFGLAKRAECSSRMGLFNGEEYVFKDSDWSFVTIMKLLWRYGLDAYRLEELTESMLGSFGKIYRLQEEGHAYEDVGSLLSAMDPTFLKMTHSPTASWLKGLGFHDLMINELVMAVTQCNYGQTPDIQAFVGAISVAGADSDLWAVDGGNRRVPEELLKASRAALLKRLVTEISFKEDGRFTVASVDSEMPFKHLFVEGNSAAIPEVEEQISQPQDYDIVIIATPLTEDKSNIKFTNFTEELKFPGRYERIVCTMVQGKLVPETLKFTDDDPLDEILVTNPRLIFNSFGKQFPVDLEDCSENLPDVWKIFSPNPLPEEQLNIFFKERNSTHVIDWLAYPHYESDQEMAKFVLTPGMYHVNAIEWAGSAMEMEIIGAKNVALLAYKYWKKDPNAGRKTIKDEL